MQTDRHFQRREEDFVCGRCGAQVEGNGYTNHCPRCLVSRHVDIAPGDRASECGGLMEPIAVLQEADRYRITHRCLTCGFERANRSGAGDDFDALLSIARKNGSLQGS